MISVTNHPKAGRLLSVHFLQAREPEPRPTECAWGVRNSDSKVLTFAAWAMFWIVMLTLFAVFA